MNQIRTRVMVSADHRITGVAPEQVPPGEHEAIITLPSPPHLVGKKFTMEHFPVHETGWDGSISLRREDVYGDDGR